MSWADFRMPNYHPGADAGAGLPAAPNPLKYSAAGNDVKDDVTQLTWRKAPEKGLFTFEDAVQACVDIDGVGTYRLPKRIELASLLDYARSAPYIDTSTFQVPGVRAWTSSEVRPFDPDAPSYWIVDFEEGKVEPRPANASTVAVALCVKGK